MSNFSSISHILHVIPDSYPVIYLRSPTSTYDACYLKSPGWQTRTANSTLQSSIVSYSISSRATIPRLTRGTRLARSSINALTRQNFKIDSRLADSYLIRPGLCTYVGNGSITNRDFPKCMRDIIRREAFSLFHDPSIVESTSLEYARETGRGSGRAARCSDIL